MAALLHPTPVELKAMSTPALIAQHIGMAGPVVNAFFDVLGIDDADDTSMVSFMAALTIEQFELDLKDWEWEVTGPEDAKVKNKNRAKERGQAGVFHRYCKLVAALPAGGL